MNLKYLSLRLVRHFMPESVARFLLKRRWVIRPGLESSDPVAAANRYVEVLARQGNSIAGRHVLVLGYGGRFAVGVELLRQGAAHVVLCDHLIAPDTERNRELLPQNTDYLVVENEEVKPRPQFMTLLHGDIRDASIQKQIQSVDFIFSTSVYEHLDDVAGITRAIASRTRLDGLHLHFWDLCGHYFEYPFELLTFCQNVRKSFLNPTSNLNRLRDYQKIFDDLFQKMEILILETKTDEFQSMRTRIRPEFQTGDAAVDAVTLIQVVASNPVMQQ